MKSLLIVAVLLGLAFESFASRAGGQKELTAEELQNVKSLVDKSVTVIQNQRESEDITNKCVSLTGVAESGTKQIVAGIIYRFKIRLIPTKVNSNACHEVDKSLSEEICNVRVWIKLPGQGDPQHYIDSCEPITI